MSRSAASVVVDAATVTGPAAPIRLSITHKARVAFDIMAFPFWPSFVLTPVAKQRPCQVPKPAETSHSVTHLRTDVPLRKPPMLPIVHLRSTRCPLSDIGIQLD